VEPTAGLETVTMKIDDARWAWFDENW